MLIFSSRFSEGINDHGLEKDVAKRRMEFLRTMGQFRRRCNRPTQFAHRLGVPTFDRRQVPETPSSCARPNNKDE